MRTLKTPILIILFTPFMVMVKKPIGFDILLGNYFNDQYKKKFHLKKRKWPFKKHVLIYVTLYIKANGSSLLGEDWGTQ